MFIFLVEADGVFCDSGEHKIGGFVFLFVAVEIGVEVFELHADKFAFLDDAL